MNFKKVKNRICVASLGVLAGLLLVFCSPIDVNAEGTVLTSKEIKHVHSGTNNSTSPNGCYTTPYDVYEDCSVHTGVDRGSTTCPRCGKTCGEDTWHRYCSRCGNTFSFTTAHCYNCGWDGGGGSHDCKHSFKKYTCSHTNEKVGTFEIIQNSSLLVPRINLIETNHTTGNIATTIKNVKWTVDGEPASITDTICNITKVGTYTCTFSYTEPYSGITVTDSASVTITMSAMATADITVWHNGNIKLTASVVGGTASKYQWYKDGTKINDATSKTYTAKEYGEYFCDVTFTNGVKMNSNAVTAMIDKESPSILIKTSVSTSPTSYQKEVVLYAFGSDTKSGIASYQWNKNDKPISGATTDTLVISQTSDGDEYSCTVIDKVGNKATYSGANYNVYVDTDAPKIEVETEDLVQNTKTTITLKDLWLASLEIVKETTTIGAWFDLDSKEVEKEYILTEDGTYTFKATDSAGNVSTKIIPVAMVGIYGLNQEAKLYHQHIDSCFEDIRCDGDLWEHEGEHTEWGVRYNYACKKCGYRFFGGGNASVTIEDHPDRYHKVGKCNRVIGKKTVCTHDQELLGTLTLTKSTDTGEYILEITEDIPHATIVSYKWTGAESSATDAFPSVRPNGVKATDVTNKTTKSVVIPDFGTYTCVVTYKDDYSGATKAITFRYKVEDFDLEPPTVSLIEDKLYEEALDYDGLKAFSEKVNTDEPFATAYKESTTLTLHLEDNMSLGILKCTSGNLTLEKSLSKSKAETVDITFVKNGKYEFSLYDCINNVYAFTIEIRCIDTDNPVVKTYVSNPSYSKKSAIYTLQIASEDYSKMKYKWLRKDHETGKVEVYKDWNDEPFVNLKDNGSYAVMVADSVYYNAEETEPTPSESYLSRGGHKHVVILNKDFNEPRLNYYYCDTEPPKVTYELRPTPRFVIVTIKATDNQDTEDELKYTCDKNVKSDKNLFYVTQNGTYKFTVTDECGNSTTISVYVDFDALTGASPSIIKDLIITPLGKTYVSEGVAYSNTGYTYKPVFKDFVDTNFVLTKWNEKGTYKQVYSYTVSENASDVLYSRYTKDETVNTGEIEYPTNIITKSIDKEAPTLAINVKNKIAYITTSDKISGVGKIEVETMTAHSKNTSYVDYSEKRSTNVTYALPMDYNTVYGIKIFDNVGNEGIQYYVSTDGILTGGINNLYVVIFVDGDGKQINEQYLIKGANAVAPEAPTKTGCTFTKWSCDYTNVNSNLLVYPVFTSNATGQILDEEIHYDESLRIKLKDSGFMFSNGGDGEIDEDKAERREIDDTVYLQETVSEDDYLLLNEDETPKTFMKQYVYKYAGSSLIIMLLVLLAFKEWNERKRIE